MTLIFKHWTHITAITVMAALGFSLYSNSFKGEFVWDDKVLVRDNMYIRSAAHIPKIFTKSIGRGSGVEDNSYRPLQMVSYMIDYSFWKQDVRGYHFINILLHIITSLTIYWLIFILYRNKLFSFLTGIFFLAHPIHTEAVAYISGRADPLAAIFMLFCFILYVWQDHCVGNRFVGYIGVMASFILALLSRENSLILPALLLLYHYTFRKKIKFKFFLPLLTIAALYILLRVTYLKDLLPHIGGSTTFLQRVPGFFIAVTNYMKLLFVPVNLHMEYGNKLFSFTDFKCLIGMGLVLFLLFCVLWKRRRANVLFFSVMWFFLTLFPVSNIYPLNAYMAEHWLYLPSIGFFIILAKIISYFFKKTKKIRILTAAITAGILFSYSIITIHQNNYWKTSLDLYQRILSYTRDSGRVYNNLGIAYREKGDYQNALTAYGKAIELNPNDAYIYNNIGLVYSDTADREKAFMFYKKATQLAPNYAEGFYNLGNIYMHKEDYPNAITAYQAAVKNNPYFADAYCNSGIAYTYTQDNEQALFFFEKAVKINPDDAVSQYNLGNIYASLNKEKNAVVAYTKAIENNCRYAEAYNNLAVLYLRRGKYELAVKNYDKAKELGMNNPVLDKALKEHHKR